MCFSSDFGFFSAFLLLVLPLGCGSKVSDSEGAGGAAGAGGGGSGGRAEAALSGSIDGQSFEFSSGDMRPTPLGGEVAHVLTLRNYVSECGSLPQGVPQEPLIVNIQVLGSGGTETVQVGDGHGATLQVGIDSASLQTFAASGWLRIDHWSTTAGEAISGALELQSGSHFVRGAFDANVCPQ